MDRMEEGATEIVDTARIHHPALAINLRPEHFYFLRSARVKEIYAQLIEQVGYEATEAIQKTVISNIFTGVRRVKADSATVALAVVGPPAIAAPIVYGRRLQGVYQPSVDLINNELGNAVVGFLAM